MAKIVFDMGATNTRVAKVEKGALAGIVRESTPENKNAWPKHLLEMIEELSQTKKKDEVLEIVGGVASVHGYEALIAHMPNTRIYNDALLAGLGEAVYGAGRSSKVVGYIGLGTGIGTSRIVGKKLDAKGFEAGHHIIDLSTGETWEEKVSGQVIKEKHGKYPQELAKEVYEEYVRVIALGVYNSMLFWSPDTLIMGGALIHEEEGFRVDEIAAAADSFNEALPALPAIVKSELGDNAGLYGAMAIFEDHQIR